MWIPFPTEATNPDSSVETKSLYNPSIRAFEQKKIGVTTKRIQHSHNFASTGFWSLWFPIFRAVDVWTSIPLKPVSGIHLFSPRGWALPSPCMAAVYSPFLASGVGHGQLTNCFSSWETFMKEGATELDHFSIYETFRGHATPANMLVRNQPQF